MNMVAGCPGDFWIFYINTVKGDLVKMHADICEFSYYAHDHADCSICSLDIHGCDKESGSARDDRPRAEYE